MTKKGEKGLAGSRGCLASSTAPDKVRDAGEIFGTPISPGFCVASSPICKGVASRRFACRHRAKPGKYCCAGHRRMEDAAEEWVNAREQDVRTFGEGGK